MSQNLTESGSLENGNFIVRRARGGILNYNFTLRRSSDDFIALFAVIFLSKSTDERESLIGEEQKSVNVFISFAGVFLECFPLRNDVQNSITKTETEHRSRKMDQ